MLQGFFGGYNFKLMIIAFNPRENYFPRSIMEVEPEYLGALTDLDYSSLLYFVKN